MNEEFRNNYENDEPETKTNDMPSFAAEVNDVPTVEAEVVEETKTIEEVKSKEEKSFKIKKRSQLRPLLGK